MIKKGLHCLSAFSAFPTRISATTTFVDWAGLHCLSAFSAFPTWRVAILIRVPHAVSIAFRRSVRSRPERKLWVVDLASPSPLPFGVQCVPDTMTGPHKAKAGVTSPLPFGVQCVPDSAAQPSTGSDSPPSPLPFGVQCVPDHSACRQAFENKKGLHCLSAFSAFPTSPGGSNPDRSRCVSIAFRRSVRSRRGG